MGASAPLAVLVPTDTLGTAYIGESIAVHIRVEEKLRTAWRQIIQCSAEPFFWYPPSSISSGSHPPGCRTLVTSFHSPLFRQ